MSSNQENKKLVSTVAKDANAAKKLSADVEADWKTAQKDIDVAKGVYSEYCDSDDYCDNTIKIPMKLYKNFVEPPVMYVYDTAYGILCPPLLDVKPSTPADIFKKFIFSAVKLAQCYMVYQILQGVSIPDEQPTTGTFTYYIPYTIAGSFVLQFLDFTLSMFPKTGFHQIVCTFQTMLTTFILNLLTTPNWGAKGEYVTLLQEVVKNQALINTLDFGLINALFPLPNCFEIVLNALDDCFLAIYLNVIKPVVDFFVFIVAWITEWIIMPPITFIIWLLTTIWNFIVWVVVGIFTGIGNALCWCESEIEWCGGGICGCLGSCFGAIGAFLWYYLSGQCLQDCPSCGCPSCDCDCDCTGCAFEMCKKEYIEIVEISKIEKMEVIAGAKNIEYIRLQYTKDSLPDSEKVYGRDSGKPKSTLNFGKGVYIKKIVFFESVVAGVIGFDVTLSDGTHQMFGKKDNDCEIYEYNCAPEYNGVVDFGFSANKQSVGGVGYFNKEVKCFNKKNQCVSLRIQPLPKVQKAGCLASCGCDSKV